MYLAFLPGPLQNPLLNGSLHHQPVDGDLFGLAEAVGPVHGLLVHCGVPVTVIEYNLHNVQEGQDSRHIHLGVQNNANQSSYVHRLRGLRTTGKFFFCEMNPCSHAIMFPHNPHLLYTVHY